ncbi:MAG: class I tRNA ligase family protein [Cyanobium sp. MAG06]|nr:class I tRNA ligase family protein [Cyanobium sp. MAG06]
MDFDLAKKHNLDYEQIIDKYGKLLPIANEFANIKINDAREKIVEKLYNKGLLVDKNGNKIEISQIEDYTHNIATAERTGTVIEPQIMSQ